MDILTHTAQTYIDTFGGFIHQFVTWGGWIFAGLLGVNFIWMCLWYSIDKESIAKALPSFLRKFFVILFFYTLMINPSWLGSLLDTSKYMGKSLTGIPIDPSSIISNGIMLGNKIIQPISSSSLLLAGFTALIVAFIYIAILAIFIFIALDLSQTLIVTTALICVSPIFLGFSALGATTQIARNMLDVIIGNCVKLLGIYIVVGAGSKTINDIAAAIPTTVDNLDPYWWLLAASFIFFLLSKTLPSQLGKIVSGAVQESHGGEAAAIALAGVQYGKSVASAAIPLAAGGAAGLAKIAGSTLYNAASHFKGNVGSAGLGLASVAAVGGAAKDAMKSGFGTVSDHFKNLSSRLVGGAGAGEGGVRGFSERMYAAAQDAKSVGTTASSSGGSGLSSSSDVGNQNISKPSSSGNPSSSGRMAAGPSSTRSEKPSSGMSKPK